MSGSDLLEEKDLATEKVSEPLKEPSRKWRNWWRSLALHEDECVHCGAVLLVERGQTYGSHCKTWPSRDIAESFVRELCSPPDEADVREYLGAFEDGEVPK